MSTYTQCVLRRDNTIQVSWIPSEIATVDNVVDLRDNDTKEWSDGWTVINTGSVLDEKEIIRQAQDHKNMKKMTDV